jgi:hypothetical protein
MCAKRMPFVICPQLTITDREAEEFLKYWVANFWESLIYTVTGKAVRMREDIVGNEQNWKKQNKNCQDEVQDDVNQKGARSIRKLHLQKSSLALL